MRPHYATSNAASTTTYQSVSRDRTLLGDSFITLPATQTNASHGVNQLGLKGSSTFRRRRLM